MVSAPGLLPFHHLTGLHLQLLWFALLKERSRDRITLKHGPFWSRLPCWCAAAARRPLPPSERVGAGCEEGRIPGWRLLCSDYSALPKAARSRA